MDKVVDLYHFNQLTKDFKSSGVVAFSNCYLLPNEINHLTNQNRLFCDRDSNGLFFFKEEQQYFQFYFYLRWFEGKTTKELFKNIKYPLLMDIVFFEHRATGEIDQVVEYWIKAGFSAFRRNSQMVSSKKADHPGEQSTGESVFDDYQISYASENQIDEIIRLWQQSFENEMLFLPDFGSVFQMIQNKQLFLISFMGNQIVAAAQFSRSGKSCDIKHLAVDRQHQRKGLAHKLMDFCFSEFKDCEKFRLWVVTENIPAINLYKKSGYVFDGKASRQLVYF